MLKVEKKDKKIEFSAKGEITDLAREVLLLIAYLELVIGDKLDILGLINDEKLREKEKILLREEIKNATD